MCAVFRFRFSRFVELQFSAKPFALIMVMMNISAHVSYVRNLAVAAIVVIVPQLQRQTRTNILIVIITIPEPEPIANIHAQSNIDN